MELLPKEIAAKVPALGSTANEADPICWVKLFYPDLSHMWYVIEFDGNDTCFGLVARVEVFLGTAGFGIGLHTFSLSGIASSHSESGLGVERDMTFKPKKSSAVVQEIRG